MKKRDDLTKGWWRKAQSDLAALSASRQAGALDAACFHAQQAAEKFLKSFLTHRAIDFPFTHNLAKLVRLCVKEDPDFTELIPIVEPLTPFAVELRYDTEFWPSPDVAARAETGALAVSDFVAARLPVEITGKVP